MQSNNFPLLQPAGNDTVSVALALYNGEKYLPQLLASLENQTLKPFELVVLDDCSSDHSLRIVRDYPLPFSKKIFSNNSNSGSVSTFKKLAQLCTGNFVAFCDQDDIWLPDKIEKSLNEVKQIPSDVPGLVFTDLSVITQQGKPLYPSYWKIRSTRPENFTFTDILYGNIVTGCTIVANRKMADELSQMPSDVIMHDWWMALIAFAFGGYRFISEPAVLFRSHDQSVTDKNKIGLIKTLLKNYKNRSDYLVKNICQAIEFRKIYSSRLNTEASKQLDRFIDLKTKGFFYKTFARNIRSLQRRMKRFV